MRAGIALSDADQLGWLNRLATQLRHHQSGAVLNCSALKEAYRRRLRSAVDNLKVVYLQIEAAEARLRVASRSAHIFPVSLVDSQLAILEPPEPAPDVLVLPATQSPSTLFAQALRWMGRGIE